MNILRDKFRIGSDDLRSKMKGHISGIALMAAAFGVIILIFESHRGDVQSSNPQIETYLGMNLVDLANPVDRGLFRESLELFYPDQTERNDSLLRAIDAVRQRQLSDPSFRVTADERGLTWRTIGKLTGMYLQFMTVYVIVLIVIYGAGQRIAVYRFVKMKQHRESNLAEIAGILKKMRTNMKVEEVWKEIPAVAFSVLKVIGKGVLMVILFSPAYVIAYSLKTTLDTSSVVFMVVLGIVSNGVLIHASNRFFTFLVAESRKGYVQTAIVKNLHASYEWNTSDGIPLRSLIRPRGQYDAHVFNHIQLNARFQFIPVLKEHASFLVTGLVIIEMALNIQGHFCYELLQQILYRQYDVVCAMIFGIFTIVKMTEITVDVWHDREKRKYGY